MACCHRYCHAPNSSMPRARNGKLPLTTHQSRSYSTSMQLHVSGLSYVYPGGQKALDNISLQVGAGENVGLVGPNGAGKTTFFLCVGGVLTMQPEILLLDEPSSHLDPRGRRELIGLVNSLSVTKIIASHDLEFILETCRRVVILDAGRVVADGPARVLLSDPALMNAHGLEVPHSLTPHTI